MKKIVSTSVALVLICGFIFNDNVAQAKSFEKNKSYNIESVNALKVDSESWDIRLKKSNSNKVIVSAKGKKKEKQGVTFKQDGRTLVIKQKDQKKSSFLGGFTFGKKGTISIAIASSNINKIDLHNKYGDIQLNEISTNHLTVHNNSGDKKIKRLSASKAIFVSEDGTLSMEDSTFGNLNISSTSGDNYMKNVNGSKVKVTSKDGEVSIKDIKEGKSLAVESDSGDIGVSYKEAPTSLSVAAKSNSSDVKLKLNRLKKNTDTEKLQRGKIGQGSNKLNLLSNNGVINVTN
ncbi:DUF4097 family beta strand repeat-containing protein [Priestia aryabhattai]|uniref:DUF4097 family beta strand repeat-containing protein n=1 Tax=Priestia aryabhattai TaxID=412384 RepID=UPI0024533890|nr:DUF4097 family beta strand repeat-containing protein [Priestia aryabhattai]MDH3113402.1 DUF4097 family beta strand repeat-containing protein [Priestia aryabhattai]MDH3127692.1 DUF4097 family beta strand repeat-containing protein [Priestia aryabhattai]